LYKLAGNITAISTGESTVAAWPFLQCLETNHGDPAYAAPCFASTLALTSTLKYSDIEACAANEERQVQGQGKIATDLTGHTYVPWVLVGGVLQQYTAYNIIVKNVCTAYTNPVLPASCTPPYSPNAAVPSLNKW
jgi:hypothetical protein